MSESLSNKLYIGIDLGEEAAMLSYYYPGMDRPSTISFVAGSNDYKLPLVIAKRNGIGHWVYGKEAQRMGREQKGTVVDRLYQRALLGEELVVEGRTYEAKELFLLYLRKILSIPNKLDYHREIGHLTIAVREVTKESILLLGQVREGLELQEEQFEVIDYKESFYFYHGNQEENLQNHLAGLFDVSTEELIFLELSKKKQTIPMVVEITRKDMGHFSRELQEGEKDRRLLEAAQQAFAKKLFSAVYFVGEAFDGGWMSESLRFICRGRRAFLGKNLYSLGACFASYLKYSENWKEIYLGDSAFKMNISLKVRRKNEMEFYSLVTAGENWYHGEHSCDVILDGTNVVELWLQHPYGREAKIENLEIADLPKRPKKTTRIRITAKLSSNSSAEIVLQDMGFGEFYPGSGKVWKYKMEF